MSKKKKKDAVEDYIRLVDYVKELGEYIAAVYSMPPCGEGARGAVEDEVKGLCTEIHRKLNGVQQKLINKIWEDFGD